MRSILTIALVVVIAAPLSARVSCKQMKSCAEACEYLQDGYTSLDRDHDGIPCEKLCHRPCKSKKEKPKKRKGK